MVRCLVPTLIECKYLNSRTLINKEFLKFLWHDTNIRVKSDETSKNRHMVEFQIEFEEWFVLDADVEIFDLCTDDLDQLGDLVQGGKVYKKGYVVERIPDYLNLDDISTLRNILLFDENGGLDMMSVCVIKDNLL